MWYIGTRGEHTKLKVCKVCKVKRKSLEHGLRGLNGLSQIFFIAKSKSKRPDCRRFFIAKSKRKNYKF